MTVEHEISKSTYIGDGSRATMWPQDRERNARLSLDSES